MDWNALLQLTRAGVDDYPQINAINVSRQTQDPFNALIRHDYRALIGLPIGGAMIFFLARYRKADSSTSR